jgi:hypothetical protein
LLFAAKEVKEASCIVLVRSHNLIILAGPVGSVSASESGFEYLTESKSNPDLSPKYFMFQRNFFSSKTVTYRMSSQREASSPTEILKHKIS